MSEGKRTRVSFYLEQEQVDVMQRYAKEFGLKFYEWVKAVLHTQVLMERDRETAEELKRVERAQELVEREQTKHLYEGRVYEHFKRSNYQVLRYSCETGGYVWVMYDPDRSDERVQCGWVKDKSERMATQLVFRDVQDALNNVILPTANARTLAEAAPFGLVVGP